VLRDFEHRDADAAADLLAEHTPWFETARGIRHRISVLPERAHRGTWVAEDDGVVVGYAEAEFQWATDRDDVGQIYALVAPSHRRRGIGSALFDRAVQHLLAHGARELRSWSFAESDRFLEQRGFRRTREERMSAVDPRTADTSALDALPNGVEVVPLRALRSRLQEVHAVYADSARDMPVDHAESNIPFEEWRRETIDDPDLTHDGSFVVLVDGTPAALSFLKVDPRHGLAEHELTGTSRAYRRQGLARLAKLAVLRWAAASGIARVSTGNDATNIGMLAINTELGFRPFAVETEWVKQVE
jgi:GNAT superfamily N-acetyltransferase